MGNMREFFLPISLVTREQRRPVIEILPGCHWERGYDAIPPNLKKATVADGGGLPRTIEHCQAKQCCECSLIEFLLGVPGKRVLSDGRMPLCLQARQTSANLLLTKPI